MGMDMNRLPTIGAAALAASLAFAMPARAQEQIPPPAPAAQTEEIPPPPAPPGWIKQCLKTPDESGAEDICQTARDLRDEFGQVAASIAYRDNRTAKKRTLALAVPPGLQIQPGIRIFIDEQNAANAQFTICYPQSCVVETAATEALLGNMKKGKILTIQAITVQGRGATFPIGLDGFAKSLDGEPMPNEDLQKLQKAWSDEMTAWLQKYGARLQAMRRQQQQQQQQQGGAQQ